MALDALLSYSILSNGTKIKVEDTTEYGDGTTNPSRAQSLVAFAVYFMRGVNPQSITINYDPETATEVLADIDSDGWYRLQITITKNPEGSWDGANYSYQATTDILVTDRYCACLDTFIQKFLNTPCGCENPKNIMHLMEMQGRFEGIKRLVTQNDMNSADQSLEVLERQCALYNEDCGC